MEQAVRLTEPKGSIEPERHASASDSPHRPPASSLDTAGHRHRAKRYARIKITVGLIGTAAYFAITVLLLATGATIMIERSLRGITESAYVVLLLFAGCIGALEAVLTLPLKFTSGYLLEHRYGLSNQSFGRWIREGLKGTLVGIALSFPLLIVFFYFLRTYGSHWWIPVGAVVFLYSVVLARLAPVLIFPLFYKFKPLEEGELKRKIVALCTSVGLPVQGVYVFDMSKNTKKANAAFAGIGRGKRIIVGDTLVANFSDEEIETVFAHELGHYKLRHLWVSMLAATVVTFFGLSLIARVYEASLGWFGFSTIDQIAALPLLGVWLGLYSLVTNPLMNLISRAHERAADRFAVRLSGNKEAFVNALRKLAAINLADTSPHPVIEFLFYSHPSIEKRVSAVAQL